MINNSYPNAKRLAQHFEISPRQAEESDERLSQLMDSFQEAVRLYKKLMYDILQQDTGGWNQLPKLIPEDSYPKIIETLREMKYMQGRGDKLC